MQRGRYGRGADRRGRHRRRRSGDGPAQGRYRGHLYEAHPHSSLDAGAFLTLAGNGMHALRQIDADRVVAAAGSPLTSMQDTAP